MAHSTTLESHIVTIKNTFLNILPVSVSCVYGQRLRGQATMHLLPAESHDSVMHAMLAVSTELYTREKLIVERCSF